MTNRPKLDYFWDIESFDNLFCVGLIDDNNTLEMHYLVTCKEDADKVRQACLDTKFKNYKLKNLAVDSSRIIEHIKRG